MHLVIHPILRVERDADGQARGLGRARARPAPARIGDACRDRRDQRTRQRLGVAGRAPRSGARGRARRGRRIGARCAALAETSRRELAAGPLAGQHRGDERDRTISSPGSATTISPSSATASTASAAAPTAAAPTSSPAAGSASCAIDAVIGVRRAAQLRCAVARRARLPDGAARSSSSPSRTGRANVHRPVRMDAIAVQAIRPRWPSPWASGSSSASSPPPPMPGARASFRCCGARRSRTLARAGFDPASHDGKALAHILETYPRDELFQISEDELSTSRSASSACRSASASPSSCAAIRSGASSQPSSMCRASATTPNCASASPRSWRRPIDAKSTASPRSSTRRCWRGCISSCARRRGPRPRSMSPRWSAQLAEAARSWADRLSEALVAGARRRSRPRALAPLWRRLPERTIASAFRPRPRSTTSSASRRWRGGAAAGA